MKPNTEVPPLKVSTIPAHHINLREGERKSIVCPDCSEWHPLRRNVIWPHHLERTRRGKNGARCPGSARRVEIDIDVADWGRRVSEADATVTGRRSNRVNRKPRTATAPAVSRLAAAPRQRPSRLPSVLDRARASLAAHREICCTCRPTGTGEPRGRCETGRELEVWLAETAATARLALQVQQRQEQQEAKSLARKRAADWRKAAPKAAATDDLRKKQVPQH